MNYFNVNASFSKGRMPFVIILLKEEIFGLVFLMNFSHDHQDWCR